MLKKLKDALQQNGFSMSETKTTIKITKNREKGSLFDDDFEENDYDNHTIDQFEIKKTDIKDELDIEYNFINNPIGIYNDNYFEIILSELSRPISILYRHFKDQQAKVYEDLTNHLQYEITQFPSLALLIEASDIFKRMRGIYGRVELEEESGVESLKKILFHRYYKRYFSLKIKSESAKDLKDFQTLMNSFVFTLAYNLNISLVPMSEDRIPTRRMVKKRRNIDFDAPKKSYTPNLVNKYISALESSEPISQFLSYYHVLEYYMDEIHKKSVIEYFKNEITKPIFSYKKDPAVMKVVNGIWKMKDKFNEVAALTSIFENYLNLNDLESDLNELELLEYFTENKDVFSDAARITLNEDKLIDSMKSISNRVYITRNSIVHSKSSELKEEKLKVYDPFKDQENLTKEIQLVKLIAEQIIINTATTL